MGQLHISAEKEVKGPWFIGKTELKELHHIIESADQKLRESLDLEMEETIRTIMENSDNPRTYEQAKMKVKNTHRFKHTTKKIVLHSKDGKDLVDDSLMGILKDQKLPDFFPSELAVTIEYGKNQLDLFLDNYDQGNLEYAVACFDHDKQADIKYDLDRWIDKYKPTRPNQIWLYVHELLAVAAFIAILIFFSDLFPDQNENAKAVYKSEAHKLLRDGITDQNINRATELLLKLNSDYPAEKSGSGGTINREALKFLIISIYIFLVAVIVPKTVIGLGRARPRLQFYRFYSRFVLITVPATLLLPKFITWINSFISG
jgi:hypothetical protein